MLGKAGVAPKRKRAVAPSLRFGGHLGELAPALPLSPRRLEAFLGTPASPLVKQEKMPPKRVKQPEEVTTLGPATKYGLRRGCRARMHNCIYF